MISPRKHSDPAPADAFAQRARQLYLAAARDLDPSTAGQLRIARRRALDAAGSPALRPTRWLLPAGAFAMIALAALMVWRPLTPPHHGAAHTSIAPDSGDLDNELPPDADQADPNLYQNLDFYGWLAANGPRTAAHRP